jgi:hypothetical protein
MREPPFFDTAVSHDRWFLTGSTSELDSPKRQETALRKAFFLDSLTIQTNHSNERKEETSVPPLRPCTSLLSVSLVISDVDHSVLELPGRHPAVEQDIQLTVTTVLEFR